jgi:hypothetical protein
MRGENERKKSLKQRAAKREGAQRKAHNEEKDHENTIE